MKYDTNPLVQFAEAVVKKLREMKISQAFHPGASRPKKKFKELLESLDLLTVLKADISSADNLPIRSDMKVAAAQVAKKTYEEAEQKTVEAFIEILGNCYWEMAEVMAKALTYQMTTTENAKKAIKRGDNALNNDFGFRFFLHATLAAGITPVDFFQKLSISDSIQSSHDTMLLEDFGWMQGAIGALGMDDGSPDGVFLIVRVKDVGTIANIKSWLGELGASRVSTPQMYSIEPEQQHIEN